MDLIANTIFISYHVITIGTALYSLMFNQYSVGVEFLVYGAFIVLICAAFIYYLYKLLYSKQRLNTEELFLMVFCEIGIHFFVILLLISLSDFSVPVG